jgi:predicted TIM-barrel fold metal-dependent hydrolase
MKLRFTARLIIGCAIAAAGCSSSPRWYRTAETTGAGADQDLAAFIATIRAVDNHSHANSVAPADSEADALALDGIPLEVPAPLHPDNPDWLAAYQALYQYAGNDLSDAHMADLRNAMQGVAAGQGDNFPTWVLDQVGTEVMLANRIAMGPGLPSPRFRWVSYVDALMVPLSNAAEAATSPDRKKLYPLEDKLLRRYLADRQVTALPRTLDDYLAKVVTPTLEAQRAGGCVAVKFEAAYLRALDFDDVPAATASRIYARYAGGGEPSHADYKALQDFLFRYIAREAGRLGMAVHIHSFEGFGNTYRAAGADPLLLEPVFTDPTLQNTRFVIVHGGGVFANHTAAMLWKPNVYADISMLTLAYPPATLAAILRSWLTQYPEKVLYGSDAVALGPDMGWELTAWIAGKNGRAALAQALTEMVRSGEVSGTRAREIATMVMRTNAAGLYQLDLK